MPDDPSDSPDRLAVSRRPRLPFEPAPDSIKEAYAVYLCTPPEMRDELGVPASEAAFARLHGLSPATLWHWRHDKSFASRFLGKARAYGASLVPHAIKCWEAQLPRSWRACEAWVRTFGLVDEDGQRRVFTPAQLLEAFQTGALAQMLDARLKDALDAGRQQAGQTDGQAGEQETGQGEEAGEGEGAAD